jgi:hypothetical protein
VTFHPTSFFQYTTFPQQNVADVSGFIIVTIVPGKLFIGQVMFRRRARRCRPLARVMPTAWRPLPRHPMVISMHDEM